MGAGVSLFARMPNAPTLSIQAKGFSRVGAASCRDDIVAGSHSHKGQNEKGKCGEGVR
jgi:hypothetical protein